MPRCARLAGAALLAATLASAAFAATPAQPDPATEPGPAPAAQTAGIDAAAAAAATAGVPVRLFNREVTRFRAAIFGTTPAERAEAAQRHLRELLRDGGDVKVEVKTVPQGRVLTLDGKFAFLLLPADANAAAGESLDAAARQSATALGLIAAESRESRSLEAILHNLAKAGAATAIAVLLVWLLARVRGWIASGLASLGTRHTDRLQVAGQALLGREQVFRATRAVTVAFFWLLVAFTFYQWLAYTLSLFPWTRPWGEGLLGATFRLAARIATGILEALPNLAVAATIFLIAWWVSRLVDRLLVPFIRGDVETRLIDRDTARPTRNLILILVWVFAIAMAYPYLPGSDSDAFKGLSVLLGLMISLGSTSLVGQAASGLIVMFTRTMRPGEFVRIGEHEGTVVDVGTFTTRIRTGLGEEITISNSTIAGGTTKNYSRAVKGKGFVVDTVVTIGYDTPWRQVHAMLVEAARRTSGIVAEPAPVVFQTGLSDFYPEYRLVAQAAPSDPRPRATVMSDLHANIQDVFNEYGVQIMSPHYRGDPADAKVVAPANWYPAPARKPK